MLMNPFRRSGDPFMLVVGMTGVKMGDRLLQVGCANAPQLAAIASKVGLSGRAVAVVADTAAAARLQRAASKAGVLIDTEIGPPSSLPVEDAAFDLAIIDDGNGMFAGMSAADRAATVHEVARVLRPGGRIMVIGSTPRTGLRALLSKAPAVPPFDPTPVLQADVFRTVRTLAEREGYIFHEGLKPRM
jgi:ubiquinone/menaquinone biosynthesis C-methylase UbiE